jgi:hypothetical protein
MKKLAVTAALCALAFCNSSQLRADNLVTNPGFETGDFTGWTNSDAGGLGVDYLVSNYTAHSGTYSAVFGPPSGDTLSQTLTTTPGTTYTVDFFLAHILDSQGLGNSFSASFGSNALVTLSNVANGGFTEYSYSALATSGSTNLSFFFEDPAGAFALDDVSVSSASTSSTPEPATATFAIPALAFALFRLRHRA